MKLRFLNLTILIVLLFSFTNNTSATHPISTDDDEWLSVRSKNFFLIGNAKEKELRNVATKLEQFRETFRLLFPNAKFAQSIETNVVVFKSKKSYKPFLPKTGDGKPDEGIAGYFQPGEDVNYITLSTEGGKEDTFGTIFHEYVHFLINTNFGRSEIPPWFNEGLAEYYQTFSIEDDQKVSLGSLQQNHLYLLQRTKLIPLKTFFALDNFSLHQNGNHSRSIFYAQAWAMMHYLIQTKQSVNMSKFLGALLNDVEQEKAFLDAFGIDYETMEKGLEKYAKQRKFSITVARFKYKLLFDDQMTVTKLSEADANAYLGDLLYHSNEYEDAEVYLQKAISLDPDQTLANTSLGLVKMRQRNFTEAKKYLEKATSGNQKNHYAFYNYAYVLSKESTDEFGKVTGYPAETAKIMRRYLIEAINLNPNFTESYRLLAFISLVNNEELDEAVKYLKKAISIQPGNQEYSLTIAQIYLLQEKFDDAEKIAAKIAKTAIDKVMLAQAQSVLLSVGEYKKYSDEIAKFKEQSKERSKESEKFFQEQNIKKKSTLTDEEVEEIESENRQISLNRQIKELEKDEQRIVGWTQKIECLRGGIKYTVKTEDGSNVFLKSIDFQGLDLLSLTVEADNAIISCDADMKAIKTVYTYRSGRDPKLNTTGNLIRMSYVPKIFKLKTADELENSKRISIVDDIKQKRQMLEGLRKELFKPKADEIQIQGTSGNIECNKGQMFFNFTVKGENLRLHTNSPRKVKIRSFQSDGMALRFTCGAKLPPLNVVVLYRPMKGVSKKLSSGEIIAMEFVPESLKL